jgi:Raf kinase inhibitor-like YbhB/YbcL family protein
MKKVIIVILILVSATVFFIIKNQKSKKQNLVPVQKIINTKIMKIESSAFAENQNIPVKYSCDGEGVNPPLQISGVPEKAQSLALTVADPDAPNGLWVHWVVWNIPVETKEIVENSMPQGAIQGQGSNGQKIYSGPCPPSGTHHYIFTLYALDAKITLPSYSSLADLTHAMQDHVLEQVQLTGLYSRN